MIHQALDWLSPSATQHVALALTHSLWQGALVAFALNAVLRLLRDKVPAQETEDARRSSYGNPRAKLRYTIACLGLLVLAALPVANLAVMEADTDRVAVIERRHVHDALAVDEGAVDAAEVLEDEAVAIVANVEVLAGDLTIEQDEVGRVAPAHDDPLVFAELERGAGLDLDIREHDELRRHRSLYQKTGAHVPWGWLPQA